MAFFLQKTHIYAKQCWQMSTNVVAFWKRQLFCPQMLLILVNFLWVSENFPRKLKNQLGIWRNKTNFRIFSPILGCTEIAFYPDTGWYPLWPKNHWAPTLGHTCRILGTLPPMVKRCFDQYLIEYGLNPIISITSQKRRKNHKINNSFDYFLEIFLHPRSKF